MKWKQSAIWLKFAQVFQIAQTLKNKIKDYDPWMENSIKVTFVITEGLQVPPHFDELKRQLLIIKFFQKVSAKDTFKYQRSPMTDIILT